MRGGADPLVLYVSGEGGRYIKTLKSGYAPPPFLRPGGTCMLHRRLVYTTLILGLIIVPLA